MENFKELDTEKKVTEKKITHGTNFLIAFFSGVGLIVGIVILIWIYNLNIIISLIIAWIVTTIYAAVLFFLLNPGILKQIEKTSVHTIEKPTFNEVPVERKIFIDRPVTKEMPVERKIFIDRPVTKEVYIPIKKAKLEIPKYNFIGSTETKIYHKRNCRLGKLVKKKYKLSNNSENYFKKKGFKPCKVCITKEKKV
ncbi:MAG TPA: hypothetical protein P5277_00480 [Candidatus Paceibacterota bacterium]|nr:hypothetical protein [Candidatus Paceibacterota bacterium]